MVKIYKQQPNNANLLGEHKRRFGVCVFQKARLWAKNAI